ncbi:MAG TPA: valine--tRNA ligase [Candidatus Paceibacterota bacterium]|jgi:valyl-tRNA synthetase|nr:valine--tRNA ligase [Parcubacteria group bacterium]MDP6119445.1 valine--tRNA ligase [Candidatus Paceibacterota bacterium]HJN62677.1 valine--tRNA ligase [Candidatus Paceibacterota bacterium]|tara:strand:- start:14208 stop:16400 length:2193 start_codon:yes stop_codon:yes gene_type:complete
MALDDKFLKPYDSKETEDRVYKIWEESGFFNPDICLEKGICNEKSEVFSIVLPPPNVTGVLHLGHSLMLAIEDIMIRFNRMRGKRTLWVPGTDHAAIATQSRVEEDLYKKEKKTKHDLGREEFLKLVEDFAQNSHDTIIGQTKKMGASLDWSREAYTLDEKRTLAVNTAFKRMYDDGLIYQGERIINWDPYLQTTVSDDEVERVEKQTPFYYLKYGPFEIATARPETKFGDKYVVMHPDDKRYAEYKHGQKIKLEWINGEIEATIVKDDIIDMEFGTGAMTITPSHDAIDFDIAERHNLDFEQIIDFKGKLLPIAGEFAGEHIKKVRPKIVEKLQEKGLVTKIDKNYTHAAAVNSRGGGTIEPQILKQWFINVNKEFKIRDSKLKGIKTGEKVTLKKLMRHVVESSQIKIIPERFEKVYYHWIDNLRDWNISRQIWYGHQIPVWYKGSEIHVDVEPPKEGGWERDSDTLDTWFSSGLWTFSTLGWPGKTSDLETYHPTSVLETGHDILFFWVARMILMTTYHLGEIPFENVYLHGTVLDEKGKKMSKSKGNAVDPLEMIEKFGADALRMAMVVGVGPGNDQSLSDNKVKAYKHFSNKVWNASRFVLTNIEELDLKEKPELNKVDEARVKELREIQKDITDDIENYRFYLAAEKLYHYFWHTFADIIIEEAKPRLSGEDEGEKKSAGWTLLHILKTSLKMLHPFMPFITEEIWSLMENDKMLMIEDWPQTK